MEMFPVCTNDAILVFVCREQVNAHIDYVEILHSMNFIIIIFLHGKILEMHRCNFNAQLMQCRINYSHLTAVIPAHFWQLFIVYANI